MEKQSARMTKIRGLHLHQMVHLSGKNIYSPIMSKNLSGVPLNLMKWKRKQENKQQVY
jgi:hypothetical protein